MSRARGCHRDVPGTPRARAASNTVKKRRSLAMPVSATVQQALTSDISMRNSRSGSRPATISPSKC